MRDIIKRAAIVLFNGRSVPLEIVLCAAPWPALQTVLTSSCSHNPAARTAIAMIVTLPAGKKSLLKIRGRAGDLRKCSSAIIRHRKASRTMLARRSLVCRVTCRVRRRYLLWVHEGWLRFCTSKTHSKLKQRFHVLKNVCHCRLPSRSHPAKVSNSASRPYVLKNGSMKSTLRTFYFIALGLYGAVVG